MRQLYIFVFLMIVSCSKVKTINMTPHAFSVRPNHVIWLQIAGLDEEHLAMIRFSKNSTEIKTSLENSRCVGSTWTYNLFDIRPSANDSFLSQLTGRKNIKGRCEDYDLRPLWSYADHMDYISGVFESQTAGDGLYQKAVKCQKEKQFFENTFYWKMGKSNNLTDINFYAHMDKGYFDKAGIFYDDSCQSGVCYSAIDDNVSSIYGRFVKGKGKTLFIIRDFSYNQALLDKDYPRARELLMAIDKLYGDFISFADQKGKTLVLLTSANSRNLELPREGREWEKFNLEGKSVIFKNSALISPVFAYGANSENFCGVFEESEIMRRIFHVPTESQLEVDVKNIFK